MTMSEAMLRVRSWPIGVLALTFALFGCTTKPDHQSNTHSTTNQLPDSYFTPDCGPTGGGALSFHFAMRTSVVKDRPIPFISITVADFPDLGPGDFEFKPDNYAIGASRCLEADKCEAATSGYLRLATYKPGMAASGTYLLSFKDGMIQQANFAVPFRDVPADKQPLMCY